jgi:hypothetical protein
MRGHDFANQRTSKPVQTLRNTRQSFAFTRILVYLLVIRLIDYNKHKCSTLSMLCLDTEDSVDDVFMYVKSPRYILMII